MALYRELNGGATAGNVDRSFTPRTGKNMQVIYGQVVLTTDATVANRRVILQVLDDDSNVVVDMHSGAVVTASSTNQHHEFMQGIYRETSFIGDAIQVPIPMQCVIPSTWSLNITIENGQAGDSYTCEFLVDGDA